jgi:hypothetical protein
MYETDETGEGAKVISRKGRPPVGLLMGWPAGVAEPAGWLLCDGRDVSRLAYADLFAVIGTRFGAGDGVTTFAVPALPGGVPRGFAYIIYAEDPDATHPRPN